MFHVKQIDTHYNIIERLKKVNEMSFASRFNKEKKFDIDTNGFQYNSIVDMFNFNGENWVYPLRAIYINTKGKYQDAPVFATDDCFVNIPSHMIDTAREILTDEQAIAEINNGKVGFQIYSYHNGRYNKDCFGVRFVDM